MRPWTIESVGNCDAKGISRSNSQSCREFLPGDTSFEEIVLVSHYPPSGG
jgi:hypothetical protein